MLGYAHLLTGALCTTIAVGHGVLPARPEVLLGSIIGSILPDIDEPRSTINQVLLPKGFNNGIGKKAFYFFLAAISGYSYYSTGNFVAIVVAAILVAIGISRHRGLIHSLIGLLALLGAFYYLLPHSISIIGLKINVKVLLDSIALNAFIHLFCDLFNVGGVKLFEPFSKRTYRLPFAVRSNTMAARLIEYGVILALSIYIYDKSLIYTIF